MDLREVSGTEARFRAYAADLAPVLGHADRIRPFEEYCITLILAEGRKRVEPLAAVAAPERTAPAEVIYSRPSRRLLCSRLAVLQWL